MSGHNKWSKIKHKKAISDSQKSRVFSKLVKLIQSESKKANGDINAPGLRTAIEKAKKENMPSDNIERAIKKGDNPDGSSLESVVYEAYGPSGIGIIIETLTDSRNRTFAEIKHILTKNNSSIAQIGAVRWAFEKSESGWVPKTTVTATNENIIKIKKLTDELKENEDVQEVFINVKNETT
ncbi:YebC/PmpR family DNA-binding transcriptional regulator [Patescibacteria group bacterium]|nr:YebC/PmpR family DNA-binding transcriptional regulator [Patescibacteria group bacterium]MBU4057337.1 YebC/PmpR family DNA-binding transcriptional regulator [Patescibacteria group bacterium]MBU4115658.1 YebC/PmpR family DNA-binding transcriptional regulator [Patescibacteria group bacterium]